MRSWKWERPCWHSSRKGPNRWRDPAIVSWTCLVAAEAAAAVAAVAVAAAVVVAAVVVTAAVVAVRAVRSLVAVPWMPTSPGSSVGALREKRRLTRNRNPVPEHRHPHRSRPSYLRPRILALRHRSVRQDLTSVGHHTSYRAVPDGFGMPVSERRVRRSRCPS